MIIMRRQGSEGGRGAHVTGMPLQGEGRMGRLVPWALPDGYYGLGLRPVASRTGGRAIASWSKSGSTSSGRENARAVSGRARRGANPGFLGR